LEVLDHNKYNYSEFVPAKSPKTLINFDWINILKPRDFKIPFCF
jgi:hypothetical protein